MRHDKTPGASVATFRKASLATFAWLVMLVPVTGTLAVALKPGVYVKETFEGAIIMAIGAYVLWLLATSAVRIRQDGVIVDNFLLRHVIPWQQLIDIEVRNGLLIRVNDAPNIGSIMYGGSLLGALTGNRLAEQACTRMNAKRKEILSTGIPPEGSRLYRRMIRFSVWPPLIILAVFEGLASLSLLK